MITQDDLAWRRLGDAVQARRHRLGMTQEAITSEGGPSHQTLRRLERGDPGPYHERTFARLEQVLDWKPGTVRAVLNGDASDDPDEWVLDNSREVEDLVGALSASVAAARTYRGRLGRAVVGQSTQGLGRTVIDPAPPPVDTVTATTPTDQPRTSPTGFVTSGFSLHRGPRARDEAIRALLAYAEELATTYGDSVTPTTSAVLEFARRLLEMPHYPTCEASDRESGD